MTLLESSMTSLEDWNQVSVKEVIDETVASLSVGFGKIGLPFKVGFNWNSQFTLYRCCMQYFG